MVKTGKCHKFDTVGLVCLFQSFYKAPASLMKQQHFGNHRKSYPPHHFVFYPVMVLLSAISLYNIFSRPAERLIWIFIFLALVSVTWLSFMLRQHYALSNQDRIVRLEMRLRYYQLTHERFEPYEHRLSFKQIAALRFAPDNELPALLKKALDENLSAPAIKKAIKDWQPDYMRV